MYMVTRLRPVVFLSALLPLATFLLCVGCDSKPQGVKIGDTPPGISGNDVRGENVNLGQLKGKIVVIFFWTNSCCGDSVKQLEALYRQYKQDGLEILAVNELDSGNAVESYAKNNALTFPMLADEGANLFKQYHVFGFPTIFILDRNGTVREKIMGEIQTEKLQKLVERQFTIQKEIEANYEKTHSR